MNRLLIKNANVITCADDGVVLENHCVLTENERIVEIVPMTNLEEPEESQVIDAEGKYLLPGLINCHEHIMANPDDISSDPGTYEQALMYGAANALELLHRGFTTIRSMSDFWNGEILLRDQIETGKVKGPSLVVSGKGLTVTKGHLWLHLPCCDTLESAENALQEQLKAGADFIKIFLTGGVTTVGDADQVGFREEVFCHLVNRSHEEGKKVAVHCIGRNGVLMAAKAGVDSIEHGSGLDEACIEAMLTHDIFLVPTLMPGYMNQISPKRASLPEFVCRKSDEYLEKCRKAAMDARKAGIRIAMGTDGGAVNTPHTCGALELYLLHEIGFSTAECLNAATKNAAQLLGVEDDRGVLERGKRADMILVKEDPRLNIETLQHVVSVIKNGHIVR